MEAKVEFILSAYANNLNENELQGRRAKLTEKYLEEEYEKALKADLPPPPGRVDEVAMAIDIQTDAIKNLKFS